MVVRTPLREKRRQFAQDAILDAAEALLERGEGGEFSMRALAEEAGVSFATPFNYFGSKRAIILGLSHRIIVRIRDKYEEVPRRAHAIDRMFLMGQIGAAAILERPAISRPVVSALSSTDVLDGGVRARSRELWQMAFDDFSGVPSANTHLCRDMIPDQLAISFRGCLSFWVSGEITDDNLLFAVENAIAVQLFGIVAYEDQARLTEFLHIDRSLLRKLPMS